MQDKSKVMIQTKGKPWSFRLGVEHGAKNTTPLKINCYKTYKGSQSPPRAVVLLLLLLLLMMMLMMTFCMYCITVWHRKATVLYVHYTKAYNEHWALSADLYLRYSQKINLMSIQNTLKGSKITWYIVADSHSNQQNI
jgi:hypothetical protein